ncbi:hypothetical protein [Nocardia sp. NPDC004604]|uniref:hypothetical protein n=1 Tax=Nocardia sp. NPDC004604 TaxID=3157013 RepID=UPI0033B8684B
MGCNTFPAGAGESRYHVVDVVKVITDKSGQGGQPGDDLVQVVDIDGDPRGW